MFNINTEKLIGLTATLEAMHKSVLPVSIRETLNDTAIETKRWIPKTADRKFITRNKSFIKSHTGFEKAKGFNINQMTAKVGILPNKKGKGSKIAEGLEAQERGGSFRGRKMIPHDKGRASGNHEKKLSRRHRFIDIKIVDSKKRKGKGKINYLLIKKGGKGTVFEIKGKKLIPAYHYRNTRTTRVEKNEFLKGASFIARKKMSKLYVKRAKIQVERELKRNR